MIWNNQWRRIVLFFILFGGMGTHAYGAESLTLDRAIQTALAQNPELLAIRQELEVARGREVKARLLNRFNPTIRGRVMNRKNPGSGSVTDSQVMLSQEVEVAGQRGLRIQEAVNNVQRVEAQIRDRERILIGDVKRAYFAARAAEMRLRLRRAIETLNRRIRDATRRRVQAGAAPTLEANLAEIRYGQSRKETLAIEAVVRANIVTLLRLLGWPSDRAVELVDPLRGSLTAVRLPQLLQVAKRQRPDLLAAEREVMRAQAAMKLTRRLIVPNPTFQGFYQTETESAEGTSTIIGGGIGIPLPLFDRKQGELVTQGGELNRGRHQVIAVTRRIEQEVEAAFHAYEAARQAVEVFEEAVLDRIEENVRFIEIAYREGKIGLLQLIVVQNDLITAQLSYIDSLAQYRTAEANLEQAIGGEL